MFYPFLFLGVAILFKTYFVPDEYFQSKEIGHYIVYRYGEDVWEYNDRIRSGLWYFLWVSYYSILKVFKLDYHMILIKGPDVLFALLSYFTISRYILPKFDENLRWIVRYQWIIYFMSTRSLVNTLEFALFTISNNSDYFFLNVVILCIIRPTSAIFYIPIAISSLINNTISLWKWVYYSLLGLILSIATDSLFYGQFTSSLYNFVIFNVIQGHSEHYGVHNPHWYFTAALPTLLGPSIIYFLVGLKYTPYSKLLAIIVPILLFSLLKHKEFRFIYPLIDDLLFVVKQGAIHVPNQLLKKFVIAVHVILAIFFCFIHQRGIYASFDHLRSLQPKSILILAPCYSFPGKSYFHYNLTLESLKCDPPHHLLNKLSQESIFYNTPQIQSEKLIKHIKPGYIVKFQVLNITIPNYTLESSYFNSFFYDDDKRTGRVEIYKK